MFDKEKVIKGLRQHCEGSMFDRCGECPYYEVADEPFQCRDALLLDALALLKEQEAIVMCKDCKHHRKGTCSAGAGIAYPPPDDWFCADGERQEGR